MTVTINTLGTNSRQIVISNETSATNIINAVNTSLTALGWTLIDTITSGSRGLLTTRVYSAPNADTVTTKYMIIRYDLHRQYWFVSCAENWNTTTNVATNESWYGNRQILLPLQYSNCTLYVFATARYACFMGTVLNEPSAWQGVFEFEREAPEDIAANTVPCFGWTSSLTIGEPYGNIASTGITSSTTSASNGFVAVGMAPPRTVTGLTGISAAGTFTILTTIGSYPPPKGQIGLDFSSGGVTQTINSHTAMLGSFGEGQSYVWNNTKTLISNLKLAGYANNYVLGKIYGLKITTKLGSPLDTTTVPVDANLFYSSTGTSMTHYLLGIHGGYSDKLAVGENRLFPNTTNIPEFYGNVYMMVLVSGKYLYFTTSTGFHKFDVQNNGITPNILPAGSYLNVKFDGENSLYVTPSAENLVYKVNLSDNTYTSLSMTGSWCALAIDDDNLYVANNVSGTTNIVKQVALSTFTETASYTVTGGGTNNVTHLSTAGYDGYVYVGTMLIISSNINRITRIDRNTGSQNFLTISSAMSTVAGPAYAQPHFFDGNNLYFIRWSVQASSDTRNGMIVCLPLSEFSFLNNIVASANLSNFWSFTTSSLTTIGGLELTSFAGVAFNIFSNSGFNVIRLVFSDPRVTISSGSIPVNSTSVDSLITQMYTTDQCSMYTATGVSGSSITRIVRYTNAFRNYNFNGAQSSNLLIAQ